MSNIIYFTNYNEKNRHYQTLNVTQIYFIWKNSLMLNNNATIIEKLKKKKVFIKSAKNNKMLHINNKRLRKLISEKSQNLLRNFHI